jgi:hypothetical protein
MHRSKSELQREQYGAIGDFVGRLNGYTMAVNG